MLKFFYLLFCREDFTKVFDVVREQIEKALITKNTGGPKTFEEFRTRVSLSIYISDIGIHIIYKFICESCQNC